MIRFLTDLFKNKEIRTRIIFTLAMLFIYMLGAVIPTPNVDHVKLASSVSSNSILEMMSVLGGGQLQSFSVFSLGVGPYITASIIVQLLSMDIIPYLSELSKSGNKGKLQMDKITRYLGVVLGYIQAITLMNVYKDVLIDTSWSSMFFMGTIMVGGTMFLLWLGDQITQKGVGNGLSLIIMSGIISRMPTTYRTAFTTMVSANNYAIQGILFFALYVVVNIAIVVLVIYMNQAVRKITIQYSSSSGAPKGRNVNHLPLKINSASVVPVIFASAIIQAPIIVLSYVNQSWSIFKFLNTYMQLTHPVGLTVYAILIVLFTFFYTHLTVDPEKISENFGKNNSYIPGVRPGKDTQKYITVILNRITMLGAIFLTFIAVLPHLLPIITDGAIPASTAPGGTGVIIVVGVALETVKELQGRMAQRSYTGLFNR